ncbi:HK97-gp10 family putative phage morphogenesis protein [Halobacillus karajensis]|uniref:Phage protein, HK97 gp10 family n=1 Tax=Halobacillus karajensis TaxID=195088 RepID=A0A059NYL1_9BACI|nr:HK97-gp10 family putative phage morphogenesis protein [Halobacillus karajensis]CDQ22572.1 phage protein, HK97 gp10 family [Halobacillus karajensis]CDQ26054.1 phage protein, HK97 gp10 family [Halobacillus karajensis]
MRNGVVQRGDKGLMRAINKFEKGIAREVKRVIRETAELIATQAKADAPFDEGNLRRSIDVEYSATGYSAKITVGAEYGIYLEFGTGIYAVKGNGRKTPWVYWSPKLGRWVYTRGIKAQPYFFPAVDRAKRHFANEMNKLGV